MPIPQIPADKAIPLAERLLAIFHEVKRLVEHPPSGEKMVSRELTPIMLVSRHLVDARDALTAVVELPRFGDGKETNIGRDGIRIMIEGEIARLSRYVVTAKLADWRGSALPPDVAGRVILTAAITVSSLLAAPNLSPEPRKEAAPSETTDATGFPGSEG